MLPTDKKKLDRARATLVRCLDLTTVLPQMIAHRQFTVQDEQRIMADPRRRSQVTTFLDMIENKRSDAFKAFSEILVDQFPHLYLSMSDWDDGDDVTDDKDAGSSKDAASGDIATMLEQHRDMLIKDIDAAKIISKMQQQGIVTAAQAQIITAEKSRPVRTEAFLDLLEITTCPDAYTTFVDAVSDLYPHVYLQLTNEGLDDDDF